MIVYSQSYSVHVVLAVGVKGILYDHSSRGRMCKKKQLNRDVRISHVARGRRACLCSFVVTIIQSHCSLLIAGTARDA